MGIFHLSWNFQGMQHKFVEFPGVKKACFLRVKWQICKFQGFLSEMYLYEPTPLEFFWNSPILMKGGGSVSHACP